MTGLKIDPEKEKDRVVKTVGGRSLVIKVGSDGGITVNDVPVTEIISEGDNKVNASFIEIYFTNILYILTSTDQVWVLSKLLFIRPEDIELAVGRIRGDVR